MPLDDSDEAWITQASGGPQLPAPPATAAGTAAADETLHVPNINNLPTPILHGIFGHLGPRELCAVSATCALWRGLNQDKAANAHWRSFYTARWRVLDGSGEDVCWQTKYGSKMKQGKSWSGKYESDNLWGHKAGVKALKLLPSQGVLLTGSLDRTIRLWDLTYGMPLSISPAHGGTVRAVALDNALVASGSSDNVVRLWHARNSTNGSTLLDPAEASAAAATAGLDLGLAESLMELDGPTDSDDQATASDQTHAAAGSLTAAAVAAVNASSSSSSRRRAAVNGHGPYSVITGEADEGLFDLSMPGQHLRGHIGPVTSLCLTDSCLYSGSWDYSVRVWRRGSWDCVSVLKYPDWVYSVVARGGLLLVASGPEVHVHDLPTGKLVRKFQNLHEGSVSCLEGTHSGRLLFSGGADGLLMAHDLRMKEASRVLWHHNSGVNGLALEDPWLVSAASDGTVVMHNLEAALPNNFSGCVGPGSSSAAGVSTNSSSSTNSKRTLGCPGQSGPMYCVDIAESWLSAGGESPAVRTWDFTRAAEAAVRAAAARAARGSSKRAAKLRKAAGAGGATGTSGAAGGSSVVAAVPTGWTGQQSGRKGSKGSSNAVAGSQAAAAVGRGSSSRLPRGLLAAAAAASSLSSTPPGGSSSSSRPDRFHKLQSRRGGSSTRQQQQQEEGGAHASGTTGDCSAPGSSTAGQAGATDQGAGAGGSQDAVALGASLGAAGGGITCQRTKHSSSGSGGGSSKSSHSGCGSSPRGRWQQYGGNSGGGGGYHGSNSSSPVPHGVWLGGSSPPVGSSRLHHSSSSGGGSSSRRHSSSGQAQQQGGAGAGSGGGRAGIPIPASRQQGQHRRSVGAHTEAAAGSFEQGWHPAGTPPLVSGSAGADGAAASPSYAAAAARQHVEARHTGQLAGRGECGACEGSAGRSCCPAAASSAVPASYHVPFSSSYPSAAQGPGPWLVPGSSPRYEVWGTTLRIAAATNCDRRLAIKRPEGAATAAACGGGGGGGGGGRRSAEGVRGVGGHGVNGEEEAPAALAAGSISN